MLKTSIFIFFFNFPILLSSSFVTDVFFQTSNQDVSPMLIGIEDGFTFKKPSLRDRFEARFKNKVVNPLIIKFKSDSYAVGDVFTIRINLFQPEFGNQGFKHDYKVFVNQLFLFVGLCMIHYYDFQDHNCQIADELAAKNTIDLFSSLDWGFYLESDLNRLKDVSDDFSSHEDQFSNIALKAAIKEFLNFNKYLRNFCEQQYSNPPFCASHRVVQENYLYQMNKIYVFFTNLSGLFLKAKHTLWPRHGIDYMRSLIYSMTQPSIRPLLFQLLPVELDTDGKTFVGSFFN